MTKRIPQSDVRRLLQSLKNPDSSAKEENWVREQLNSAALQDALWALGRAVFLEQSCRVCAAVLAHHVHLKVVGDDADAEYPQVRKHLDFCPSCSAAYEELYQMVSAVYAAEVPVACSYPDFDLSFLPEPVRASGLDTPRIWEDIISAGQQVSRLSSVIRVVIYREMACFGQLFSPLSPTWVALPVTRDGAPATKEAAQALPVPCPEHDLSLSLMVGPVSDERATLSVQVATISSQQLLSRVRVTLLDEKHRVLASEMTRGDGRVIFRNMGTGSYSVEIKHRDKTWELPLAFDLEEEAPDET